MLTAPIVKSLVTTRPNLEAHGAFDFIAIVFNSHCVNGGSCVFCLSLVCEEMNAHVSHISKTTRNNIPF